MADFTTLRLEGNHGTHASPTWVEVGPGANREVRWSDSNMAHNTASAAWPAMIRPTSTTLVSFTYAYTADATGWGFISGQGTPCPAYAHTNFRWARWWWDNVGTFASAPIFTAYPGTAVRTITRGDGSLLGGHVGDSGSPTARSYLKGNAFGRVDSAGSPAAAPTNAPTVTDGTTGSVSPTAGANWLTNFQSLQGDNDWITAPFTPAATTQDTWSVHFALFTGPNMVPALYTIVMSLRYTWT